MAVPLGLSKYYSILVQDMKNMLSVLDKQSIRPMQVSCSLARRESRRCPVAIVEHAAKAPWTPEAEQTSALREYACRKLEGLPGTKNLSLRHSVISISQSHLYFLLLLLQEADTLFLYICRRSTSCARLAAATPSLINRQCSNGKSPNHQYTCCALQAVATPVLVAFALRLAVATMPRAK